MAYGINNPVALAGAGEFVVPGWVNNSQVPLSVTLSGSLRTRDRSTSAVDDSIIVGSRSNQIEVNFSTAFSAAVVTNTTDGTHGSAVQGSGCATYSTGAAASAYARGTSVNTLSYRPGHEWYCYFTASFTPGVTGSRQRLGCFNATDGFWIGYEGSVFGISQYQNSVLVGGTVNVAPTTPWTSANGDQCLGQSGSAFTSGGTPVVIDYTKINIYRLHGAWFGSAPVILEVFSPDGEWVIVHAFRFPNTLTTPYTYSTNWAIGVDVTNTTNTSNLAVVTPCWGMGATDAAYPLNTTVNDQTLAPVQRSVLCGKYGVAAAYINVGVDSSGNLNSDISGIGGNSVAIAKPGVMLVGLNDGTGNSLGSINGALKVTEAGALHAYGQVSCTSAGVLILAANASRKSLTLSNPTGSVIVVYIGDVSVTASTGFPLNPGQTVRLETVSAVYGITSSTSQTVGYIEIQ